VLGFENGELDHEERLARMPAVAGPLDAGQEQAFELGVVVALGGLVEAGDMAFHGVTSSTGARLFSLQTSPSRS
jgi:hypothetical protein